MASCVSVDKFEPSEGMAKLALEPSGKSLHSVTHISGRAGDSGKIASLGVESFSSSGLLVSMY